MVFFNFLNFFLLFWNFLLPVWKERNRAIIFIFSLSQHFPTYFGLGWIRNGFFQFSQLFLLFFWNFVLPVGKERNVAIIFSFSLSQRFPTYFSLEWSRNGIFQFLEFFCYFFGIFSFPSGRNETKRYFLFSHFLSLFQHILAWNEVVMVSFNFFNFFAMFLEFSLTRREGTKRSDNF